MQDVYRDGERRVAVGRVDSGTVAAGRRRADLAVQPPRPASPELAGLAEGSAASVTTGEKASVVLADRAPVVERGDLLVLARRAAEADRGVRRRHFWLGGGELVGGRALTDALGAREVHARVMADPPRARRRTCAPTPRTGGARRRRGARSTVRCDAPIAVDDAALPATGRFVLVDDG